jgi:predicted lipid-binding transport protein (Tim44 family)
VELLFFAAVAVVVLCTFYSVLGRRVGRQPEEAREADGRGAAAGRAPLRVEDRRAAPPLSGVAELRARDPGFDPDKFLDGALTAYEMIVKAYAAGDRVELKSLTTPQVFQAFDTGLTAREAQGRTETVEFLQPPRADVEDATVDGDLARVRVRFLAELRSRTKDATGEGVDDRRTAELWTFERPVASRDPNWALARVEAAEA